MNSRKGSLRLKAPGRVEERLASVEREPLTETKLRLEAMMAERAMKTALAFY